MAVLALHAVTCWLLLFKMRVLEVPEVAQSLELLWIPPSPVPIAPPEEPGKGASKLSKPAKPRPPEQSPPAQEENPAPLENPVTAPPPIDWQAELAREARASASAKSDHHFKEFDFPRRSPPAARAPEFAWDRNSTHRVESVSGALLLHLNENCVFVMTPLPFVFCRPGKRPPNGSLFGHMNDLPPGAPEDADTK